MRETSAAYDKASDLWIFEVTDVDGTVLMFRLTSLDVIQMIQSIKGEVRRNKFGQPLLRLIQGGE